MMRPGKGIFLATLLAIAISLACAPAQGQQDQQSVSDGKENGNQSVNLWQPADAVGLYTLILTAFTGILAISTGFLWWETNRGRKLGKDALVADKRAFVFAIGYIPRWEPNPQGGWNWRFHFQWRNSGATPTRNLHLSGHCELRNTDLPPNFVFSTAPGVQIEGFLGPETINNGILVPNMTGQPAITPQNIQDIQAGNMHLFVWGTAHYSDVFDGTPEHHTHFAWRVLPLGDPFAFDPAVDPNGIQFTWVQLPRGNSAD